MNLKLYFAALTSVSMVALSTPVAAQGTADQTQTVQGDPAAGASAAPSGTGGQQANADIIVTATRRSERLQDVPLTVNALTGDQLQEGGFQSLTDIQYQFSGVQFGTSPNDAGFRLRGVGTAGGFSSASEQNVGTVVDNVVIPFGNPVGSLGDIDRVEVLKGPQGTQFGKNSSSGVVNITTRRPDFNAFGVNVFGSYAELDEHDIHGNLNIPIASNAAFAFFAFHRQHDGLYRNVVRNERWGAEENYGFRAKLLWQLTPDFSAYLIGDWSRYDRFGPGQAWTLNTLPSFANPLMAARFGAVLGLGIVPGFNNRQTAEEYPGFGGERNYGTSLELNLRLGQYSLTSITAYRKLDNRPNLYAIDATQFPIFTAQETGADQNYLSEELRVTSPAGQALEFVGGVYLSRRRSGVGDPTASAQLRPALPFSAQPQLSISAGLNTSRTTSESAAVFVDGSLRVAQGFRLIGGLRVGHDKVDAENFSVIDPAYPPFVGPNGFTVPYTPRPLQTGTVSNTDWSGRFGFDYKPTEDLLFFATIARGYLGPTVTFSALTGTRSEVSPQTVRDITIGAKTQWFDHMLTFNVNAFFDNYRNLQTSVFNGLEFLTENAGGFRADGFEVEVAIRPSPRFSINGSFTYSHTRFTDYVTACPASIVAAGAAAVAAQCNAPGSTAGTPLFQADGEPLAGSPKYSATLGADFNQPIGRRLALDASVNFYYRSKVNYDVGNTLAVQGGYNTVGATLGIGDAGGAWRVGVFARNLFNTRFHAAIIGLPFSDAGGTVNWLTREGRRTIGVSGEFRF